MGRKPVLLFQHEHLPRHHFLLRSAERWEETHHLLMFRPRYLHNVSTVVPKCAKSSISMHEWFDECLFVSKAAAERFYLDKVKKESCFSHIFRYS